MPGTSAYPAPGDAPSPTGSPQHRHMIFDTRLSILHTYHSKRGRHCCLHVSRCRTSHSVVTFDDYLVLKQFPHVAACVDSPCRLSILVCAVHPLRRAAPATEERRRWTGRETHRPRPGSRPLSIPNQRKYATRRTHREPSHFNGTNKLLHLIGSKLTQPPLTSRATLGRRLRDSQYGTPVLHLLSLRRERHEHTRDTFSRPGTAKIRSAFVALGPRWALFVKFRTAPQLYTPAAMIPSYINKNLGAEKDEAPGCENA
ncbi:hypothetical protein VTO73DRAFT_10211 [Trametes versicolor]